MIIRVNSQTSQNRASKFNFPASDDSICLSFRILHRDKDFHQRALLLRRPSNNQTSYVMFGDSRESLPIGRECGLRPKSRVSAIIVPGSSNSPKRRPKLCFCRDDHWKSWKESALTFFLYQSYAVNMNTLFSPDSIAS